MVLGEKKNRKSRKWSAQKVNNRLSPIRHYVLRGNIFRAPATQECFRKHKKKNYKSHVTPNYLKGWLNADIISGDIYLNANRKMPFKAESFDFVYCKHFIEHLEKKSGMRFL